MLTKFVIQQMKEEQLCFDVLIPLLKAMGYKDVTYTHGGVSEQGKDIVCWKSDDFGSRQNYALVVKAKPINGQARVAKGTAGEVVMQIQQAFGKEYIDPITLQPQFVNACWVVTNHTISPTAEESVKSALAATIAARSVRFINGEKLWEFVEQYLVKDAITQKILDLQSIINNWDKFYTPEITISGSEVRFGLREKFDGASKEKPLTFKTTFTFPNSDIGKQLQADFESHLSTGASITIPAGYFRIGEIPDALKPVLAPEFLEGSSLQIWTVSDYHFHAKIEVVTDDGDQEVLENIDLRIVKSGRDETTLENVEPDSPFKLQVIVNSRMRSLIMHMEWDYYGKTLNAAQLYKLLNFQLCVSKSFVLRLVSLEHQLVVFEQDGKAICQPPKKGFMRMARDILEVQQRIKKPLMLPVKHYTQEDIETINKIREILRKGKIVTRWDKFNVTLINFDKARVATLLSQPNNVRVEREESIDFFGTEIPLGIVSYVMQGAVVENSDEVMSITENMDRNTVLKIYFASKNEKDTLEIVYSAWYPPKSPASTRKRHSKKNASG